MRSILNDLQKKFSLESTYVPYYNSSIADMVRNMAFAGKGQGRYFSCYRGCSLCRDGTACRVKLFLPIHDSVFIRESKGFKKVFFKWIFLKWPVKRCRFVTTISEKSKNEIVEFTGCDPSKVVVIPDPVNDHFYFREKEFHTTDPVLLFIGSTPNKNLDRIIESISTIPCTLDIVGRIPEDHLLLLKKNGIRFRQYMELSETEMADRYAASDIVMFPSLYEGFGLPILEGQKAGRAVLTSNISPMQEVAGEGACLVDPYDPESIRSGIKKIIGDDDYRRNIIKKGFENLVKYNNQHIADQYLKLYTAILNS